MSNPTQTPIDFPLPKPETIFHPSAELSRLQRTSPVVPFRTADGRTGWLVTRYEDVRQVLVDPRFSRAEAGRPGVPDPGLGQASAESILGMDPPEHTRLRRLVAGAFTARRVEALRPRVTELVHDLIDHLTALDQPADLVENFSLPLPVQVICELLGVPPEDRHMFHAWSDGVLSAADHPERIATAFADLTAYFQKLIALKRKLPADDLMTALIAARDDKDRLSEEELVRLGLTILVAGHETTANQINLFLINLHEYPDQLARLRANPGTIPQAVEELMRFVQLGPGGAGLVRVLKEEMTLSGVRLPAGSAVVPVMSIANRDPLLVSDPDRLDVSRPIGGHLGFGAGVHHCLGAQLARVELQEALHGLLTRLPGLRIDVPPTELRFKDGMILRSLHSLPVRW
ncbi:cytochrome P450 [Actinoplanes sp. N902-109]|uniref:cytochrome P450 n=1 Tax=Actinoplanes sp. (strain N902-109) TaxID=649831 RepID=UPI0003293A67|nr:cytochrome P450 [Actinoplanes sp. N902-109]AGL17275.1 cytochrome P450 hydroxylase [Actinoplanes sp. N902-109]